MHVCSLMRKIWREVGLFKSNAAKIQAFIKFIETQSSQDWDRGVQEFRNNHYDVFNDVIPPLMESDDKLLRLLVIHHADPKKRKELNLLKDFARQRQPDTGSTRIARTRRVRA